MKNRSDHEFEVPSLKDHVPEQVGKIGQKAMMSSTSIFVNVDVTPGQRKVTTDDPSLN